MKNPSSGNGRTDRQGEANSRFSQFCERPYNSPSLIENCFISINNLKVFDRRKSPVHIKYSFYRR